MYYSGITLFKETDDIAKISLYLCFVATHALGHMMYGCTVVRLYIYIYIYVYINFLLKR